MTKKKWIVRQPDQEKVSLLSRDLHGTSTLLCQLFVNRGMDTYGKTRHFFTPSPDDLNDPFLMRDMQKAVDRVIRAFDNREKILIFGDYDVDGTTSTAMLLRFFSKIFDSQLVSYYIPDRYKEGYGLSTDGLQFAQSQGISLIITVDCGITGNKIIEAGKPAGIDFIVCDHHLAGDQLPDAAAILNPLQPGCPYPYKGLCGCGVAFKLIQALCATLGLPEGDYIEYLDMVALATGADVVPVTEENRALVHLGLIKLNRNPCAGIKALKATNTRKDTYNLTRVIFGLAPKINAAGRMKHGALAVDLLSASDEHTAAQYAKTLSELNEERRSAEALITDEALLELRNESAGMQRFSTVIFNQSWHKGVLGIVASRLIETYHRPTIVLSAGDKYVSGSARSIRNFNIYNAIYKCRDLLINFGGHPAAAGLTLAHENLEPFKEKFESVVRGSATPELLQPCIYIDMEIALKDINFKFFNTLQRMEPFGQDNPRPVFVSRNVRVNKVRIVGEDHLKLELRIDDKQSIDAIGFRMKERYPDTGRSGNIDVVYTITENRWNGQISLQLKLLDFKGADEM